MYPPQNWEEKRGNRRVETRSVPMCAESRLCVKTQNFTLADLLF